MITFSELKHKSSKLFPALFLEKYSSYSGRKKTRTVLIWVLGVLFVAMFVGPGLPLSFGELALFFRDFETQIRSAFFFLFSFWIMLNLAEAFYFSYYFRDAEVDFEVAKMAVNSDSTDITKSFLDSQVGKFTMMRLGVGQDQIQNFLQNRKNKIKETSFDIDTQKKDDYISIKHYGNALYNNDQEFSLFLTQYKINVETFIETLEWIDDTEWKIRKKEEWWDRSNLARIQGIGRNWSFGKVYLLEKYGRSIYSDKTYVDLGEKWRVYEKDAKRVESVLVKKRDANVSLVAPTTNIGMQIVSSLGKMIINGDVLFEIENRRIFVLDTVSIMESVKDQTDLERLIRDILFQANQAGNVILVIPNFSVFVENAHESKVDVVNLFSDFLSSSRMQIVIVSDKNGFHENVETNLGLMQHFEKVLVSDVNKNSAIKILQNEVHRFEANQDVFFTYQSLKAMADGAERYFVGMTYSDKIIDLIEEVVVGVKNGGRKIIKEEDTFEIIEQKTGVPQGKISEKERVKLENLEEILHKRIVGQNLAVDSISKSMRIARSGISDSKRPMGSFIFIGPTGVGKTETVKALNQVFFGADHQIIRLDMSEYNGEDAIEKLIGSYSSKTKGILSSQIRDQQYGILLLDEFEKTTDKIKDLFLQILDEGQFKDAEGDIINCRNLIIIATSNAGSQLIYNLVNKGSSLEENKDEIINKIINEKIFKPELINRFDGSIIFHSLNKEHLEKIAEIMLNKLNVRIKKNGITIKINKELIGYLVSVGSSPKFGAREMSRKIKENIESVIADKIISNEISSGDILEFVDSDSGNTNNPGKESLERSSFVKIN